MRHQAVFRHFTRLGRPVIYTCRKDVFDDEKKRPHFDTNHHLTVIWDPAAFDEAMTQLKTVISVTLPAETILEDALGKWRLSL